MMLFYLLPELNSSFSRHILLLRHVRVGEGKKQSKVTQSLTDPPRISSFWLKAPSVLCSCACKDGAVETFFGLILLNSP